MRHKPLLSSNVFFRSRLPPIATTAYRSLSSYNPSRLHHLHPTTSSILHHFNQLLHRNPLPHISTFNILLAQLVRSNSHPQTTLSLYSSMLSLGIVPTPHTHATLAHSFSRTQHPYLTLLLLSDSLRRGTSPNHPPVLGALVHALCASGKIADAVALLEHDSSANVISHTALVNGACRTGKLGLAMTVIGRMVKTGCKPNHITLNVLVHGLCKVGKIADAVKVFDEMPLLGHPADNFTYAALVGFFCREQRIELCFGFLGLMLKRGIRPDKEILTMLANGLCGAGSVAEATSMILSTMPEMGCYPDVVAFNTLVSCFGSMERVDLGFVVLGAMLKRGWRPSTATFNSLLNGMCVVGKLKEAAALVERMEEVGWWGCSPNVITYNTLVKGLVRMRMFDAAIELVDGLALGGRVRPDLVTFATIIDGLCKQGEVDKAAGLFERMKVEGISSSAYLYRLLVYAYTHLGRWNEAVPLLNEMKETSGIFPM